MSNLVTEQADTAVDVEDLVRRFRAGEAEAFDRLVIEFQSKIFNFTFRMLNNYEDAVEITQDVFVKAYRVIDQFRGQSRFSTWLFAIAANMCRNRLRKTRNLAAHEVRSVDEDDHDRNPGLGPDGTPDDPSRQSQSSETMDIIRNCVSSLPAAFGTVMILRDLQGQSYEEIADALGCSLGTVKSRLARARDVVRTKLEQAGVLV